MERKKVLLSDDVSVFVEMEKSLFRRDGIDLFVAQSGQQVLEIAASEQPDLVLIDLHLPEIEGDECCRRIKADGSLKNTPVVLMANAQWEEEIRRCRESGCDEVIFKPFNRDHLLKTARELLGIADRRASRAPARIPILLVSAAGNTQSADSMDLSTGGLFVESQRIYALGTELKLLFELPGRGEAIRCRGRVAWVNYPKRSRKADFPPGVGIQFTAIREADLEAVRDHVEKELGAAGEA